MWHKITPFPRHCVSVPCNVTRLVTWSLLSCFYPWWRDHCYPGTGAAEQKCCVRGWVLGGHSDHWSGLACLNWSWLVAIPINVLTFWKYQRHNWRTLVITRPGRSNGTEMRSRVGWCWWRWWWRCWCWWWCWWRWRCWLLTSSALPTTLAMPLLAMLNCIYTLMSLFIFFLHWIDAISQHHTSQ